MRRWPSWTRDPAIHFILFAVVYGWVAGWDTSTHESLTISRDLQAELWATFESQHGRPPGAEEWSRIQEDLVTESILVREARSLGLHEEDTIIRRRLAQKMEKLALVSDVKEPTDTELAAYLETHQKRYTNPERLDIEHRFFSNEKRGVATRSDAIFAKKALTKGAVPDSDAFPHGSILLNRSIDQLRSVFGSGFTEALPPATDQWFIAPSQFGYHVARITGRRPATLPELVSIRERVVSDWTVDNRRSVDSPWLQKTRENYTIEWETFPE